MAVSAPTNQTVVQDDDDLNNYVTVSRLEISQILHALARDATLVTASVGADNFFLTSILEVDEEGDEVLIESGRHNRHKARVLERGRLLCMTSLDKIKIRFRLEPVTAATHGGQEAFAAPLPRELMRLQRREYYRMSTPVMNPVKVSISNTRKDSPATVELSLLDISCGGVAVMTPPEMFAPEIGGRYECVLKLPGGEPIKTQVQARNAFVMMLANGKTTQRSGFAFVDLPQRALATIQRYLMQLERERRNRTK